MTSNEHHCFPFLTSPSQASLSSSSSSFLLSPTDFNNQRSYDQRDLVTLYPQSQEVDEYGSNGGSDDRQSFSPPSLSTLESGSDYGFKLCEGDQQKGESSSTDKGSVSWMSSKMRLMKKMINSDKSFDAQPPTRGKLWFQDPKQSPSPSNTNSPNPHDLANNTTIIRTCSDCNTTKTPLWRSGPKGPKSLCNACGIRQRKARRALAAAATATTGNGGHGSETSSIPTKVHCNKKKSGKAHATQQKKQFKAGATPDKKQSLGFEDFILNLSNNLALHRVISQDETEAAILLMALSCGLVSR